MLIVTKLEEENIKLSPSCIRATFVLFYKNETNFKRLLSFNISRPKKNEKKKKRKKEWKLEAQGKYIQGIFEKNAPWID